ncbi:MAG: hypothetical protein WA990_03925 [Rubrobacteraceae bacterium]
MRFLFLSLFGFSGGVLFLLFFMVPVEARLKDSGMGQGVIDIIMSLLTFGWVAFGFLVTAVFSWFLISHRRSLLPATGVVGVVLLSAFAIFYFLLDTNTMIAMGNLNEQTVESERLTFGSYPDLQRLEELEDQGYDGVITLLNPSIPFERVLLEEEKANGKEVGLEVHSFPMLPWISANGDSLRGIDNLVNSNDKRYYINCYLGEHRVDLVRDRIMEDEPSGAEMKSNDPVPEELERGPLAAFDEERIVIGPYPTDEEWFDKIVRQDIKEIVSTLDPDNPDDAARIKEERKIAEEYDMTFTLMPLDPQSPEPAEVREIALYAWELDYRVYIHDYSSGPRFDSLNATLGVGRLR